MDDRSLLEAAAKAAWIELDWDVPPNSPPWRMTGGGEDRGPASQWNPLADDGDALRLAVKLELAVGINRHDISVSWLVGMEIHDVNEWKAGDTFAATRRAIVRAAAEIGRTMP